MAYDEELVGRFRDALGDDASISEKRMMGGICFFINGNMLGGANRTKEGERRFMFRVGKDNEEEALGRPGASLVELGGRRMGGMIFVAEAKCGADAMLEWITLARNFVDHMPPKK